MATPGSGVLQAGWAGCPGVPGGPHSALGATGRAERAGPPLCLPFVPRDSHVRAFIRQPGRRRAKGAGEGGEGLEGGNGGKRRLPLCDRDGDRDRGTAGSATTLCFAIPTLTPTHSVTEGLQRTQKGPDLGCVDAWVHNGADPME